MFSITADGKPFADDNSHDGLSNVTVTLLVGEHEFQCRNCGNQLDRYTETERPWHSAESGGDPDECRNADPDTFDEEASRFGPHVPMRVPLQWCESAEIDFDEGLDSVTVSLMIGGSPVALTVHRINDASHQNYGKLVALVPYAGMSTPLAIEELQRGALVIER